MALSADQRDLFLSLIEGIHESPPWGLFLRNLLARMGARRACMIITFANAMAAQVPSVIHATAPRAAHDDRIDIDRLGALRLHPHSALRPGRVYALDEMLDYDDRARLERQRDGLAQMGIRHGRWLRVSVAGLADAWLVLVREREDFGGSAVAQLDAVAVHLAAALRTLCALNEQRLQSALAGASLGRLGVGQLAFDCEGRVMAADAMAERAVTLAPEPGGRAGRRLHLRPEATRQLEAACAGLAGHRDASPVVIVIDEARHLTLLLRPCDFALAEPAAHPAVIGVLRQAAQAPANAAIGTLAACHGLSTKEAALALALSRGETLAQAGARLRLTEATARNYSKRIYARTGATGQADLVRIVLTGLAPLA